MNKKRYIIILFLVAGLLNSLKALCQKNGADSLKEILSFAASDTEKVNVLNRIAIYYRVHNEDSVGIPYAFQALRIAKTKGSRQQIAGTLANLALMLWNRGKTDSAIIISKQAQGYYVALGVSAKLMNVYKNMAAMYAEEEQYPGAIETYIKMIDVAARIRDSLKIHLGYTSIGGIYEKNGEYDLAVDYYKKALNTSIQYSLYADEIKDYVDIGNARSTQGIFSPAVQAYFDALKVNDEHGKSDRVSAIIYVNIANIYNSENDTARAMKYNNEALKVFQKLNEPEKEAALIGNIGNLYMEGGNYAKAKVYQKRCLEMLLKIEGTKYLAKCYTNLGELYERTKQYDTAFLYYNKALEMQQADGNAEGETYVLSGLSKLYSAKGDFKKAEEYGVAGFNIAYKLNLIKEVKDLGKILSDLYTEHGAPDKAFYYYKQYVVARDTMDNKDNSRRMIRAELNYKYEQEQQAEKLMDEKKDALNAEKARHDKVMRNLYLGGFILVLFFILLLFRSFTRVRKANKTITEQKAIVEQKNRDITDSINYAKRIQQAMLPTIQVWNNSFKQSFIYYKPKDIVSGDFYWCMPVGNDIIVAVADCTGHGVPGAFMSMLGISSLNKIVGEKGIKQPAEILNNLRDEIIKSLNPEGKMEEVKDGMDMTLCYISRDKGILEYAAANNPLLVIRKEGEEYHAIESEADKMPVGKYFEEGKQFTSNKIDLKKGDRLYMFTDGYADQFGGDKGKKFKYRQLIDLLVSSQQKNMSGQKEIVDKTMESWKGNLEQVDDILVTGIEIV